MMLLDRLVRQMDRDIAAKQDRVRFENQVPELPPEEKAKVAEMQIEIDKLEKECEGKRMDQIQIRTEHLENLSPIDDIRAKADFRLDVVSELILRAVRQTL